MGAAPVGARAVSLVASDVAVTVRPAIAAPAEARPPRLTIVATYPVEPSSGKRGDDAGDDIRDLLRRYEAAYDRRDVATAATLWPSVLEELKALDPATTRRAPRRPSRRRETR